MKASQSDTERAFHERSRVLKGRGKVDKSVESLVWATHPPFFFLGRPGEAGSIIAVGTSVAGSLVLGSSPAAASLIVRLNFTFPPNPAPYYAKAKREDGVRFVPPQGREGGGCANLQI